MARNKAGFIPLDLAVDDTMRRALELSTETKSETTMSGRDPYEENVMGKGDMSHIAHIRGWD